MEILKTVLTIIFVIDCIVLAAIVLLQGRQIRLGLERSAGQPNTYWGHNKGRSMEGTLVKVTRIVAALFMILALVLNLGVLN